MKGFLPPCKRLLPHIENRYDFKNKELLKNAITVKLTHSVSRFISFSQMACLVTKIFKFLGFFRECISIPLLSVKFCTLTLQFFARSRLKTAFPPVTAVL